MPIHERDITRLNVERLPGETHDAYQAFLVYARLQFNDRNFDNVQKITGYSLIAIKTWKTDFDWINRASVLDAEEDIILREDRMKLLKADNLRYAEKTRQIKDKAFEIGEEMLDVGRELLKNAKLVGKVIETDKVETKDGRMVATYTELHMKSKISDIPRLVDVGMKVTQLAAGLPTEIVESSVLDPNKLKDLSAEEIQALIDQENRKINEISAESKLTH